MLGQLFGLIEGTDVYNQHIKAIQVFSHELIVHNKLRLQVNLERFRLDNRYFGTNRVAVPPLAINTALEKRYVFSSAVI